MFQEKPLFGRIVMDIGFVFSILALCALFWFWDKKRAQENVSIENDDSRSAAKYAKHRRSALWSLVAFFVGTAIFYTVRG